MRSIIVGLSLLFLVGCAGPGYKADLPLAQRFPLQQVTLILGGKVGTYNCYVDHEQQSLYACEEIIKETHK